MRPVIFAIRNPAQVSQKGLKTRLCTTGSGPATPHHAQIFLDDTLILGAGAEHTRQLALGTTELMDELGLVYHTGKKSVLTPVESLDFLGFELHVPTKRFYLSTKQKERLREKTSAILAECTRRKGRVQKLHFAKVVGYLSSCCLALRHGRYNLLDFYRCLHKEDGWKPSQTVRLSATVLRLLHTYWCSPPSET